MILTSLVWILHGLIPLLVLVSFFGGPLFIYVRVIPIIGVLVIALLAFMGYWKTAGLTLIGSFSLLALGCLVFFGGRYALGVLKDVKVLKHWLGKSLPERFE